MFVLASTVSTEKLPIIERTDLMVDLDDFIRDSRDSGSLLGLILVQICHIAEINFEYGYDAGDAVVVEVCRQIQSNKRSADVLVRIGVDELLLVLPGLKSNGQPILAAQRILNRCADRIAFGGRHIKPSLRIAVSVCPNDAQGAGELVRCADAAMFQGRGRNQQVMTYGETVIGSQTTMLSTQYDLEAAMVEGELYCAFQPKVDLKTRRLGSLESLMRWQSRNGREIPPGKFIPVAEENGLITSLTFRSLNESIRECAELQGRLPGLAVAVNLSTAVLHEPNLKDIILEDLRTWSLPNDRLILEVTESAVMQNVESGAQLLEEFRELGIGVSIDDFGTGQSSLAYLKDLPANELKIDRSFVKSIVASDRDRHLVQTIIDLGQRFGMKTVAEGIEDIETFELLASMGCDTGQGYFIARPMRAEQLEQWFSESACVVPGLAD